jgi:hypothetical protein
MMSDTPLTAEEFWSILHNQPEVVPVALEFRLYHDENGFPLFFSTEDNPGNYIVVDKDTYYGNSSNIRVVNGKLKTYYITFGKKLVPADIGQSCDPNDVCVIVPPDQQHIKWNLKHQDTKND